MKKIFSKAVWYIDDNNIKHFTVIFHEHELSFLKMRFDFVGTLEDY